MWEWPWKRWRRQFAYDVALIAACKAVAILFDYDHDRRVWYGAAGQVSEVFVISLTERIARQVAEGVA